MKDTLAMQGSEHRAQEIQFVAWVRREPAFHPVPPSFLHGTCFLFQQQLEPAASQRYDAIERNVVLSIVETVNYLGYLGLLFCSVSNRCQACIFLEHSYVSWCPTQFGNYGIMTITFSTSIEATGNSLAVSSVICFLFFFL